MCNVGLLIQAEQVLIFQQETFINILMSLHVISCYIFFTLTVNLLLTLQIMLFKMLIYDEG